MSSGCWLFFSLLAIFLTKFLNASRSIDYLLLACVKRMANRANFDVERLGHGGTGLKGIAATARHGDFLIAGMNVGFHGDESLDSMLARQGVPAKQKTRIIL